MGILAATGIDVPKGAATRSRGADNGKPGIESNQHRHHRVGDKTGMAGGAAFDGVANLAPAFETRPEGAEP